MPDGDRTGKLVPALVAELEDDEKALAALQRLQAMIERGEGTLADYLLARGFEQRPIRTESGGEIKAVAEFQDASLPRPLPVTAARLERLKLWPHAGIVPVVFDTHEVGSKIEVKIHRTADPHLLECRLDFKHGQRVRDRLFDAGPLATGDRLAFSLTDFLTSRPAPGSWSARPAQAGRRHRLPGTPAAFELVLLTVTAPPAAPAATRAENEPRWTVRAEVQMLALPQTKARALMPRLREPATFPAAYTQLQEMLAVGEAELLGAPRAEGFCQRSGDPGLGASSSFEGDPLRE